MQMHHNRERYPNYVGTPNPYQSNNWIQWACIENLTPYAHFFLVLAKANNNFSETCMVEKHANLLSLLISDSQYLHQIAWWESLDWKGYIPLDNEK